MKALDLLKTILENGLSSYNEEDDTVLVNGWWVTLEECIAELEALQSRSCESCKYGIAYLGTDRKWCEANIQQDGMTTVDKDFCCNRYEPKGK